MQHVVLNLLLVIATVLGVGMVMPQILRLHKTRSTEGVSIAWIGVGVAMNTWWTAYAIGVGLWGLLPVSAGGVLLYLTMARQVVQLRGWNALGGFLLGAVVLGLVPAPAYIVGGIEAAGVAVGLCYGIQFLPAVVESFRAVELGGLSPSTWLMALGEAMIWVVYGAAVTDVPLIVGGIGGSLASAVIVAQLIRVRKPRIVFTA